MRRLFRYCILFVGFFLCFSAQAVLVRQLNMAEIPVSSHSHTALQAVLPDALRQVLIKLSANPQVSGLDDIKLALTQSGQYVSRYHYIYQNKPDGTRQLAVQVWFDQAALTQLLQQTHQSVWSSHRPETLLWLSVDNGTDQSPTMISSMDTSMSATVQQLSSRIGFPMLMPAMDLQDQNLVDNHSAMPFNQQNLVQAATRYHVVSVLAGRLSIAVDGSWQAQWMYVYNGKPFQWNTVGQSEADVLSQALGNMTNIMTTQLALHQTVDRQQMVMVQVLGVNNLDDYAVIMSDLKQLADVSAVSVQDMSGSVVTLSLKVRGGKAALTAALKDSTDLSAVPESLVQATHTADLYYQYQSQSQSQSGGSA